MRALPSRFSMLRPRKLNLDVYRLAVSVIKMGVLVDFEDHEETKNKLGILDTY